MGKSTFLRLLGRAFPEWRLVAEPVAQWQKVAAGAEEVRSPPPPPPTRGEAESGGLREAAPPCRRGAAPSPAPPPRQAPGSGNLLQRLYQEPSRWSFTFQTFSCLGRLKAQLERPAGPAAPVRVFERSVYSDRCGTPQPPPASRVAGAAPPLLPHVGRHSPAGARR